MVVAVEVDLCETSLTKGSHIDLAGALNAPISHRRRSKISVIFPDRGACVSPPACSPSGIKQGCRHALAGSSHRCDAAAARAFNAGSCAQYFIRWAAGKLDEAAPLRGVSRRQAMPARLLHSGVCAPACPSTFPVFVTWPFATAARWLGAL